MKIRPNIRTSWNKNPVSPQIHPTSFVDPTAVIIGHVIIGEHVNIAPGAVIRADEGMPVVIGNETNIQDGVIIHSLKGQSVNIGNRVSLAHGAIIHGPATIGDGTFVGFGSLVFRCNIGSNCVILHKAVVTGNITVPNGKYIATCSLIQSDQDVESLPDVSEELLDFASEVIEVNKELAQGYNQNEKQKKRRRRRQDFWNTFYNNLKI